MSQKTIVVVFGIDHHVGHTVANSLVSSGHFYVRGVSTSPNRVITIPGVEPYTIDPTDSVSILQVLTSADACFVYTCTNFDNPNCLDDEIAYGCLIADCCKDANVPHTVLCSQLHSNNICSLMARHLVAKAEIEQYMREIGLPLTCLILSIFYQDILVTFKPTTNDGRLFNVEIPMGKTPLDMINRDDVGPLAVNLFLQPREYISKTLSVCGDKITVQNIAAVLSKWLHPKVFKDKQITPYEFQQKALQGTSDLANMFQFFQRVDQRYNLSHSKQINPNIISFNDWVKANAETLKKSF